MRVSSENVILSLSSQLRGRVLLLAVPSCLTKLFTANAYQFPAGVKLKDGQHFDYIVVGAGAGGAAAAARLALSGQDVLLIEAGGDPNQISRVPAAAMALLGSDIDWQYKTTPNNMSCLSSEHQQCRFSRGKCLGGSTTINYMLYTRGNRKKDFQDIKIPGWTFKNLIPYFLRYEGLQDLDKLPASSKPYHNTTGTMRIGFFGNSGNSWHSRLIKSYMSLNFPFNPDVNAESQIGVSKVVGYVYKGERMSTARGYLARQDVKKVLKIAKKTMCTGVIIDQNNIARGVTVIQGSQNFQLYANKEVVLSAGTIGTPQILMLSGIGNVDHLRTLDIPINVDLPVGDGLSDHVLPLLILQVVRSFDILDQLEVLATSVTQFAELLIARQGALTSNGLTDVSIFANTRCFNFTQSKLTNISSDGSDCEVPNVQIINAYIDRNIIPLVKPLFKKAIGFNDNIIEQLSESNKKYAFIAISPILLEPRSSGTVRLMKKDPLSPPAIYPNYLADKDDVEDMVRSIGIVEQVVETPTIKQQKATLLRLNLPGCPSYDVDKQQYWRCYVRHMTFSVYHAVGTAALGRVVDARLRVFNVKRLRVGDLSVLPGLPHANTEAVTVAIGERVAEMLLEDNE